MREAREELGPLPRFEEKGAVLTVRGVAKEKEYTVFVCEVDAATVSIRPGSQSHSRQAAAAQPSLGSLAIAERVMDAPAG